MKKMDVSEARVLYSKLLGSVSGDIKSIRNFFRTSGLPDAVSLVGAEVDYKKACALAEEHDFNGRLGRLGHSLIVLRRKIESHPIGLEELAYARISWNLSHYRAHLSVTNCL